MGKAVMHTVHSLHAYRFHISVKINVKYFRTFQQQHLTLFLGTETPA